MSVIFIFCECALKIKPASTIQPRYLHYLKYIFILEYFSKAKARLITSYK